MHRRRPPVPIIVLLVIAIAAGIYYGFRTLNDEGNGALTASGSIEATTVNVSPEMAGKVAEVLVEEGQAVKTGDPLLRLDDSLLTAQRAVAAAQADSGQAALVTAQTNYDLAVQNALAQQQASTAKDWRFSAPDEFNQPAWYFQQSEQLTSAQGEVAAAKTALEAAEANLNKVITDLNNAELIEVEERLANARAAFLVADAVKTNADFAAEGGGLQKAADEAYNAALDELRAAQNAYNDLLDTQATNDVERARGVVIVAQQRHDAAYDRYLSLQTGLYSPSVIMAQKALDQANTAWAQASANIALLDAQLAKLTVYAPMDGVVLTRNVEPGEFVQPGTVALTVGDLSNLTITVYVPNDRLHEIQLDQHATVMLDSAFAKRPTFDSVVAHIADEAEFTPRNVQTVEGRSGTVFAVKLKVIDPTNELKIGMPADVVFK